MRDLGDLGVKVLYHELQNRPHLRFVHAAEPFDEVVDGCALCEVAKKGRHWQSSVFEPRPRSPCRVRSPPPGTCSSPSCGHLTLHCRLLFRRPAWGRGKQRPYCPASRRFRLVGRSPRHHWLAAPRPPSSPFHVSTGSAPTRMVRDCATFSVIAAIRLRSGQAQPQSIPALLVYG